MTTLLDDIEWGKRSDSWIAASCCVSHTFVKTVREATATVAVAPAKRQASDGRSFPAKLIKKPRIETIEDHDEDTDTEERPERWGGAW